MTESIEGRQEHHEYGEGYRLLHQLEQSGEYVFHGSPHGDLAELKPMQATIAVDGQKHDDGPEAIAASPFADFAIFRALTRDINVDGNTSFGTKNDGTPQMSASKSIIDSIKGQTGYVYVFPKSTFSLYGDEGYEWRSAESQKPERIIKVTDRDFPQDVSVIT